MVWELFWRFLASHSKCGVFNTSLQFHNHSMDNSEIDMICKAYATPNMKVQTI